MQEEIKKGHPNGGNGSSFGHSVPNSRIKDNLPVYTK